MERSAAAAFALLWLLLLPAVARPAAAADGIALYSYGLPPGTIEHKNGISGPVAQVVAELVRAAGVPGPPVAVPVARLLALVEDGNAMAFPLGYNAERAPKFRWVVKLFDDVFAFATVAPRPPVNGLGEGRTLALVTVNNAGAPKTVLTDAGFANLDHVNSEGQNALRIFAGHADAWFGVRSSFKYLAEANKLDPSKLVIGAPVASISAWLIGSKNLSDDVVGKIQARFEEMKSNGEYDAIMRGLYSN